MNHITAQIQMSIGHGGNRYMTPRYIESVAGKDRNARMNRTQEL